MLLENGNGFLCIGYTDFSEFMQLDDYLFQNWAEIPLFFLHADYKCQTIRYYTFAIISSSAYYYTEFT